MNVHSDKIINCDSFAEVQKSYRRGDHRSSENIADLMVHIVGDGVPDTEALTSQSLRDSFSSGNGNPFVCFADISPKRGITFQESPIKPRLKGEVSADRLTERFLRFIKAFTRDRFADLLLLRQK